jgi:hypothetical protein
MLNSIQLQSEYKSVVLDRIRSFSSYLVRDELVEKGFDNRISYKGEKIRKGWEIDFKGLPIEIYYKLKSVLEERDLRLLIDNSCKFWAGLNNNIDDLIGGARGFCWRSQRGYDNEGKMYEVRVPMYQKQGTIFVCDGMSLYNYITSDVSKGASIEGISVSAGTIESREYQGGLFLDKCLRWYIPSTVTSGNYYFYSPFISVVAGNRYTGICYIRTVGGYRPEIDVGLEANNGSLSLLTEVGEYNGEWQRLSIPVWYISSGITSIRIRIRVNHVQGTPTYVYITGLGIYYVHYITLLNQPTAIVFRDRAHFVSNEGDLVRYSVQNLGVEKTGSFIMRFKRYSLERGIGGGRYLVQWTGGWLGMGLSAYDSNLYWRREGTNQGGQVITIPNCVSSDLNWHTIILTWDSGRQKAFFDGRQVIDTFTNINTQSTITNISIGGFYANNQCPSLVEIRDVGFFNKVLDSDEVQMLTKGISKGLIFDNGVYEIGYRRIDKCDYDNTQKVDVKVTLEER